MPPAAAEPIWLAQSRQPAQGFSAAKPPPSVPEPATLPLLAGLLDAFFFLRRPDSAGGR